MAEGGYETSRENVDINRKLLRREAGRKKGKYGDRFRRLESKVRQPGTTEERCAHVRSNYCLLFAVKTVEVVNLILEMVGAVGRSGRSDWSVGRTGRSDNRYVGRLVGIVGLVG